LPCGAVVVVGAGGAFAGTGTCAGKSGACVPGVVAGAGNGGAAGVPLLGGKNAPGD
jgi:hypothetical protein